MEDIRELFRQSSDSAPHSSYSAIEHRILVAAEIEHNLPKGTLTFPYLYGGKPKQQDTGSEDVN